MEEIQQALGPHELTAAQWEAAVSDAAAGDAAAKNSAIVYSWMGHATFLLSIGGLNVLTDPVFSQRCSPVSFAGPKRILPPACSIDQLPRIDVVLISHNHYDHLDCDSVRELARRPGATEHTRWFVPAGLKAWFDSNCKEAVVEELSWWEEAAPSDRGQLRLMFTPAKHWTKRGVMDDMESLWGSWAAWVPSRLGQHEPAIASLWFSGDTGYATPCAAHRSVFEAIGDHCGQRFGRSCADDRSGEVVKAAPNVFDLALIGIGAYEPEWFMNNQHITPEQALEVHLEIRSRFSVGHHWATFQLADEPYFGPRERLAAAVAAAVDEKGIEAVGEFGVVPIGRIDSVSLHARDGERLQSLLEPAPEMKLVRP
eukprot:SAG31_NODE_2348_length_5895_cov_69.747930_1_plen_369_part_00